MKHGGRIWTGKAFGEGSRLPRAHISRASVKRCASLSLTLCNEIARHALARIIYPSETGGVVRAGERRRLSKFLSSSYCAFCALVGVYRRIIVRLVGILQSAYVYMDGGRIAET